MEEPGKLRIDGLMVGISHAATLRLSRSGSYLCIAHNEGLIHGWPRSPRSRPRPRSLVALTSLAITGFVLHRRLTFSNSTIHDFMMKSKNEKYLGLLLNADFLAVSIIMFAWVVLAGVVNPIGNFPLNDDWSYGRTVKILLEQHRFYLDGWNTATFSFQALYGLIFCIPFGFSFSALRLSTIVLGGVGIVGLYYLLRQVAMRREWAVCGALILMFNPIYFVNSFTFMTDVPFTAFAIISALFLVKSFRSDSNWHKTLGFVFLCCATMIRQITLPIALSYGFVAMLNSGLSWRSFVRAFWPALGVASLLAIYNFVISALGMTPALADAKQDEIAFWALKLGYARYAFFVGKNAYSFLLYLCAFALPLTGIILPFFLRSNAIKMVLLSWRFTLVTIFSFLLGCLACFYAYRDFFHVMGNNLNQSLSLGSCDVSSKCLETFFPWNRPLVDLVIGITISLVIVTTLTVFVISVIYAVTNEILRKSFGFQVVIFSFFICIGLIGPFSLFHTFDRYLLPIIPFVLLILASVGSLLLSDRPDAATSPIRGRSLYFLPAVLLLVASGIICVAGTHDYLAWNRVRWRIVSDLINKQGIAPEAIDGGLAVSGWELYAKSAALRNRWGHWYTDYSVFRMDDAKYQIGFDLKTDASAGCKRFKIASYPLSTWMLPRHLEMGVFQRYTDADEPSVCK
jgi:hypothetical protein